VVTSYSSKGRLGSITREARLGGAGNNIYATQCSMPGRTSGSNVSAADHELSANMVADTDFATLNTSVAITGISD